MKKLSFIIGLFLVAGVSEVAAQWTQSGTNLTTTNSVGIGVAASTNEKLTIGGALGFSPNTGTIRGNLTNAASRFSILAGSTIYNGAYIDLGPTAPGAGNGAITLVSTGLNTGTVADNNGDNVAIQFMNNNGSGGAGWSSFGYFKRNGNLVLNNNLDVLGAFATSGTTFLGGAVTVNGATTINNSLTMSALPNTNIRMTDKDIYFRGGTDINHGLGWYDGATGTKKFNNIGIDGPVLYGYLGGALGTTTGGQKAILQWNNTGLVSISNKVIIGAINPTNANYKLFVETGILTEKVKVSVKTSTDWADYVFADNYKMKTLSEVEQYVKTNKHLPNVPSADEVVKEGIDMATMDAKLLEKIEELTLYMIEMDKEVKALKAENAVLKQVNTHNQK